MMLRSRSTNCTVNAAIALSGKRLLSLTTISLKHKNFKPADKLTINDLNENVLKAKYAVRGKIPARAEVLKQQLIDNPSSLPFKKVINANIGNPQQLNQKPLTFYRQVLSLLQYPMVLDETFSGNTKTLYKQDAIERAKRILNDIGSSVGSYSSSQGVFGLRKTVAEYISRRDGGEKAYAEDIFLTAGASSAVSYLLNILCKGKESGVLIPIPQYPLYTATLALNNTNALPYYLEENSGWSTNMEEIENVVHNAIREKIIPRVLVVINPGNPTGAILSVESIEKIFDVAAHHGIVVIADEVYQENIFPGNEFHSMKKVLRDLQRRVPGKYENVQLASLHSTSKGVSGECGQRGGYMELTGFSTEIKHEILKLCSISLCPVVTGQALVDLMTCPPKKGEASYEQDQMERSTIHSELYERATYLWKAFNEMEGVSCQKPQGSMYLFPKIDIPHKALEKAQELDITPDELYCAELLEATGICTVPGSGFGQKPGTFHLRTTFLAPGTSWIDQWREFHQIFCNKYRD
ncbi:hypothetical protein TPHA_0J00750 [Tetrapisispora phaffii CBS 4417]|uniref:Glutamate pyruvate transaminase n=1 Tax=Tetrapisispora phaffii (strain ATCC 24235 / CBS 4417 / NBRC 1672 / NRRL Y-8282 / UCD 70-5) TaxID=1071381 RepID=G8BYF6_TETPH|nr:hypothetical protein TPHA_0J00750 [Tetrapisispora phaffii CBS 4417]CCE64898.1 hypothetical protein TPHA_0J00750 [Tetrapisispora phaffii CBS 4417]